MEVAIVAIVALVFMFAIHNKAAIHGRIKNGINEAMLGVQASKMNDQDAQHNEQEKN